jgi:hypothetical protein
MWAVFSEYVAPLENMNPAAIAYTRDGISGLHLERLDTGLVAREKKDITYSAIETAAIAMAARESTASDLQLQSPIKKPRWEYDVPEATTWTSQYD